MHLRVDENGVLAFPLLHRGPARPLALRFTMLPPGDAPGLPENILLFQPGRDTATPRTPTASCTGQAWHWRITDPLEDNARWQVIFPTPRDLTAHRVPAARFLVEGEAEHILIRLLHSLADWPGGVEYPLPFTAGVATVVIDPYPDPMLPINKAAGLIPGTPTRWASTMRRWKRSKLLAWACAEKAGSSSTAWKPAVNAAPPARGLPPLPLIVPSYPAMPSVLMTPWNSAPRPTATRPKPSPPAAPLPGGGSMPLRKRHGCTRERIC